MESDLNSLHLNYQLVSVLPRTFLYFAFPACCWATHTHTWYSRIYQQPAHFGLDLIRVCEYLKLPPRNFSSSSESWPSMLASSCVVSCFSVISFHVWSRPNVLFQLTHLFSAHQNVMHVLSDILLDSYQEPNCCHWISTARRPWERWLRPLLTKKKIVSLVAWEVALSVFRQLAIRGHALTASPSATGTFCGVLYLPVQILLGRVFIFEGNRGFSHRQQFELLFWGFEWNQR